MALEPTSSGLVATAQEMASVAWAKLHGSFSSEQYSPETALANKPGIDPRFLPRVPMSNGNIDASVLTMLGRRGFKRGKEITAQTHPELYGAWVELTKRAGLKRVPQLILAESDTSNAVAISSEEVLLTTGLLKILTMREVKAVLGHELGHETSEHTKPRVIAHSIAGGLGLYAGDRFAHRGGISSLIDHTSPNPGPIKRAARWVFGAPDLRPSPLSYLFYMAIGVGLGSIVANQVSVRPTELEADRKGAQISGDPEALISALEKLVASRGEKDAKQWFRFIKSGYPSHASRINHLRDIAKTMPTNPVMPDPVVAPAPVANAPTPQITAASLEERVVAPAVAQAAAL